VRLPVQCIFNLEAKTEHESNGKYVFRKPALIKEINHWFPAIKETKNINVFLTNWDYSALRMYNMLQSC
jgi:hypothetical protein